jgi:hypothetical protein
MFSWFRRKRSAPSGQTSEAAQAAVRRAELRYFWARPPRCIKGFKAELVRMPGVRIGGHAGGTFTPTVWLKCTCGCDSNYVLGHYWKNPDNRDGRFVFVSPLALKCGNCNKITELIDTDIHGYDSEVGVIPTNHRGDGKRVEFICEKCGPRPLQVFAGFEYSNDLFERDNRKHRGREFDLFSWFSLIGKCASCNRLISIVEFECA